MGLFQIISLGLALGTDSFSVSVGIGTNKIKIGRIIRLSLLFSVTQALLLIIGFYSADFVESLLKLSNFFSHLDPRVVSVNLGQVFSWIGAAILIGLGLTMIRGCFAKDDGFSICNYNGRIGLIILALSVSIDALTAGFSLAMLTHLPIFLIASASGFTIWLMAFLGLTLGKHMGRWLGNKAELFGGLLLIYLAIYLLV